MRDFVAPGLGLAKRRPGWMKIGGLVVSLCLGGLVAGGGCLAPSKPATEAPSGPSEEYERASPDPFATEQMTAAEAEQAAKVAAAQKVLEKVKDRDPEEERKKMARSRAISAEARKKLAKRAHDDAVKTARDALKVHEQNVDAMLVVAEVYYKEGKYELTRAVASSALQVDARIRSPEDTSRAYNLQGFAMLAMGEPNAATQSFKKAAEADEKNAAAWNNLGTRYLDAGDVVTATACFKYAIELDPRFFKAQLNYGASLRAERKWQEAESAIRKSLTLRPNYAEAYFNLGVLYLDADPFPGMDTTQRLNKAIQNLDKYRDLAIDNKGASLDAGTVGIGAAGSAKAPPPRVSKARAEDYIRVAKKGLEREARRLEREKGRKQEAATQAAAEATGGEPAGGEPVGGEPAGAGDAGADTPAPQGPGTTAPGGGEPAPSEPDTKAPDQPAPAKPAPAKPAPAKPGSGTDAPSQPAPAEPAPSKPAPSKPAPSKPAPSKPAPQGPSQPAPSKPAPSKPAPSKPAPSKPAPQGPSQPAPKNPVKPAPSKPAPSKPAPQGPAKPAPSKPAPQGPAKPTPTPPSTQKPSVQKPQSASIAMPKLRSGFLDGHGPISSSKKLPANPAWRGTRSSPSTLNSMEAGASGSPCVALVLMSPHQAVPALAYGLLVAHDLGSSARHARSASSGPPPSPRVSSRLG